MARPAIPVLLASLLLGPAHLGCTTAPPLPDAQGSLAGAAAEPDRELWSAARTLLNAPDGAVNDIKQAEATLDAAGLHGDVVLARSLAGIDLSVLPIVTVPLGCAHMPTPNGGIRGGSALRPLMHLGKRVRDVELAAQWSRGDEPLLATLGLLALHSHPDKLAAALQARPAAAAELPAVREARRQLFQCVLMRYPSALRTTLAPWKAEADPATPTPTVQRCTGDRPDAALLALAGRRDGSVRWNRGLDGLTTVTLEAEGTQLELSPACTLGLFVHLASEGNGDPMLLSPIADPAVARELPNERLLEGVRTAWPKLEAEQRRTVAVELARRGLAAPGPFPMHPESLFNPQMLELAAEVLANVPGRREAAERALACLGHDTHEVLSLINALESAEGEAKLLLWAQRCGDDGALSLLLRRRHPDAPRLLAQRAGLDQRPDMALTEAVADPHTDREAVLRALTGLEGATAQAFRRALGIKGPDGR